MIPKLPATVHLSWTPRLSCQGRVFCSPACGNACTLAAYKVAVKRAEALAKQLGAGWRGEVWENLGWHWKAVSESGACKVHPSTWRNKVTGYTAFLGDPTFPGGDFAQSGKTPAAAVSRVCEEANRRITTIQSYLCGGRL